ncbi:mechanosensitive ion channel family protein [Motiliproteus sediminis]|uniref:mechanosensitive ion channel family protein n=1 Tax=Motiliproteus sediminis TaxID=1468178 RepID=UPI001AF00547|nr:mechanosensitive ion channel family protein [Motiliproteus sediminis]
MNRLCQPLLCALLLITTPAFASEAQPSANPPPAEAGTELFQTFERQKEEISTLRAQANELSGEESAAINSRLYEKQLAALEQLIKMADLIQQRQQDNLPVDELRDRASPILLAVGQQIIDALAKAQTRYQRQSAEEEQLSADGLRTYIGHLNKLSNALEHFTELTLKNQQIGLDDKVSLPYLRKTLRERAQLAVGTLEVNRNKLSDLNRLLKVTPKDDALLLQKDILIERNKLTIEHLRKSIALMQQLDIATDEYQQHLISLSGEITPDMLDIQLASQILSRWSETLVTYFADNGIEILFKVLIFLAILALFRFLSRLAERLILRSFKRSNLNLSSLMKEMVTSIASRLVMLLGVLIALSQIGISLGPLLAGLGVVGFIIGFALQDTLGNFASGMMILIYRPYDVGDMVEAAGVYGEVKGMSLVSTTILTVDNQTLMIPNNKIWGDVIKNVTAQKTRRVDMVFGIAYSDDIEHAERIFRSILEQHDRVLKSPAAVVKLHNLGESSVDFIVRPWVKTEDYWEVYWDVTREVKLRLDSEGLNIPFPQRDVHLYPAGPMELSTIAGKSGASG